jgi:hypothetical protein
MTRMSTISVRDDCAVLELCDVQDVSHDSNARNAFMAVMRFDRDVYEVLDDRDGYYVDDVRGIFHCCVHAVLDDSKVCAVRCVLSACWWFFLSWFCLAALLQK